MRARFFDGKRATAQEASLHISDGTLAIRDAGGAVLARWVLRRIVAPDGVNPDGSVVLAESSGQARLVVSDAASVAALVQSGVPIRATHGWSMRAWIVAACLLAGVLITGVLLLAAGPRLVARLLPDAWGERLGGLIAANIEAHHAVCHGRAGQQALDTLVDRLRAAGDITRPVHLEMLDDPTVNAVTLPGARVIVLSGLVNTVHDGGELAGVIAHELGHVAHRDPTTLLLRQMGIGLVAAALGWNDSLGNVGGMAQQLLTLSYSRGAEAAADAAGETFLARAGLRADGLGRFFAQMEAIEGHDSGIAWFATHPPTEFRRAHATRSTAGAPPFTAAEWQAVREMCR